MHRYSYINVQKCKFQKSNHHGFYAFLFRAWSIHKPNSAEKLNPVTPMAKRILVEKYYS